MLYTTIESVRAEMDYRYQPAVRRQPQRPRRRSRVMPWTRADRTAA